MTQSNISPAIVPDGTDTFSILVGFLTYLYQTLSLPIDYDSDYLE